MLVRLLSRTAVGRLARRLPIFKIFVIAEVALLAHRHLARLDIDERHRLATLVRRGRSLTVDERAELRELAALLEPRAFLTGSIDALSPLPVPKRLLGGKR